MLRTRISRVLLAAIVMSSAGLLFNGTEVVAGIFGTRYLDQTGCCRRCPACDHVCKLDAEQVEEEKTCFDVESKVICIPRVVFPWQMKACKSCNSCDGLGCTNCVNNGARTRKICVLKTDKYKCPKCKYTWSAEKTPCASGACCDAGCAGCDAPGCAAPGCDVIDSGYSTAPTYRGETPGGLQAVQVETAEGVLPAPSK